MLALGLLLIGAVIGACLAMAAVVYIDRHVGPLF